MGELDTEPWCFAGCFSATSVFTVLPYLFTIHFFIHPSMFGSPEWFHLSRFMIKILHPCIFSPYVSLNYEANRYGGFSCIRSHFLCFMQKFFSCAMTFSNKWCRNLMWLCVNLRIKTPSMVLEGVKSWPPRCPPCSFCLKCFTVFEIMFW